MSAAPAVTAAVSGELGRPGPRRRRRRLVGVTAGVVAVLGAAGVAVAIVRPFGGSAGSNAGVTDNGAATGVTTVAQRTLTSQTQVNGTLKYGGSSNVVAPAGTAAQALTQAEQQAATAQAAVNADETAATDSAASSNQTLSQNQAAVTSAQSQLTADQGSQTTDCAGTAPAATQACNADRQAVVQDQTRLTQAQNALANARLQATQSRHQSDSRLASDRTALQNAENALTAAQASAANPGTVYTELPAAGARVTRGQQLYALSGIPVPLFYGQVTPWRDFAPGMGDGPDVAELTDNLIALGFGAGLTQDSAHYSSATQAAVERWQASIGAPQTGIVHLGDVVFEAGEVIVTSVTPTVGGPVQPGQTVLQVTSSVREVEVDLDAAQQSQVEAGDRVTITLPDSSTTDGTVSTVGTVATTPSGSGAGGGGNGGSSTPTIEVDITLTDPSATGNLDQAPVQVAIVTASVPNALVVPITALVALAGGGYAVEEVDSQAVHHLVAVTPGLFDDADGLVQVTGGIAAGDRIVVPSS